MLARQIRVAACRVDWIDASDGCAIASRSITTVNAVAPGFIATPMTDPLAQPVKDAMMARIPLGRMGTDAEIAAAIVYFGK